MISAFERGHRELAVSALNTLLDSAGFSLTAVPEPTTLRPVRDHGKELVTTIAELGGMHVSVFGSVAREDDRPDSDVDLLVDVDPTVGLFNLMRMKTQAEKLIGRTVDVIPRDGLKVELVGSASRDEIPQQASTTVGNKETRTMATTVHKRLEQYFPAASAMASPTRRFCDCRPTLSKCG